MNAALLAVFGLGLPEVLGISAIVLLLFGAKMIPELAKGLGQGIKEFKKAASDTTEKAE
ncbi:MAG TPA: twin-arginine translocase TatA/TatE family subunit [Verrucomicrobiae bacterium]